MKVILQDPQHFILRFHRNEDVFEKLLEFCTEKNIKAAWFTGIGAASEVILSYYHLSSKTYQDKVLTQEVEVLGITGNIAILHGKTVFHSHGSVGDEAYHVFGGHFKKIIVSATLEIHLSVFSQEMTREFNEETGLNLLR